MRPVNRRCHHVAHLWCVMLVAMCSISVADDETLVLLTDVDSRALQDAWITPWTKSEGVHVTVSSNSDIASLILAPSEKVYQACAREELTPRTLGSTFARGTVSTGELTGCGIPVAGRSVALAYRRSEVRTAIPMDTGALFDLDTFPGKRALVAHPDGVLEWALRSYGVPIRELYVLLSTRRGLKLVFNRLEKIRDHVVWCDDLVCTQRLLRDGTVDMAMVDARAVSSTAIFASDTDIGIVDQEQWIDFLELASIARAAAPVSAARFVEYATSVERINALASALGMVNAGTEDEPDARTVIIKDSAWYARTRPKLEQQMRDWLDTTTILK